MGAVSAHSATRSAVSNYVSTQNYATMQPFLNDKMRQNLNPGDTQFVQSPSTVMTRAASQSGIASVADYTQGVSRTGTVPTSTTAARAATTGGGGTGAVSPSSRVGAGTNNAAGNNSGRRVVARGATTSGAGTSSVARAASTGAANASSNTSGRRVVARAATTNNSAGTGVRGTIRGDNSTYTQTVRGTMNVVQNNAPDTSGVTSERCLADYTACMENYCHRSETLYDRCYCSSKLAQIDSTYQQSIRDLTEKILIAQGGGNMTRAELEAYWQDTFGDYTGNNSLAGLYDSLDIDWSDTESRVRGQKAFATGHEYCMQHTRACYYMAEELRGIYRSTIARDCKTYETYLNRLETAAEAILNQLTGG